MYARVAIYEGAEPEQGRKNAAQIREMAASGPPEGVKGKPFMLLINPDEGKTLAIGIFETEADMLESHEVLNAMDPPVEGGMGQRTAVEMYEVAVQAEF